MFSKKRSPNALCWDKSKEKLMRNDCGEGVLDFCYCNKPNLSYKDCKI